MATKNSSKEKTKKADMVPEYSPGDLVYITPAGHEWMTRTQKYKSSKLVLVGRTAVIQDVYDWESPRGKEVLKHREENGKWAGLNSLDFKYILLLLFPEVPHEGKQGVGIPDVMPELHPRMEGNPPLFEHYPKHLAKLLRGERPL